MSTNVVRELLDRPQAFEQSLGGVITPAAIEYLSAMVECVFRFNGTLDKFIGDAVMAVWGNVQTAGVRNDVANAVRAAPRDARRTTRLNAEWRARGLPELRVGIAVNHGEVVVGNIGSPQRMEFTVIGDAVNTSWKLQELTKELDTDLVVSGTSRRCWWKISSCAHSAKRRCRATKTHGSFTRSSAQSISVAN